MTRRLSKMWWWLIDWVRYLGGRETRDQAWIDGSNHADAEWQEFCDDKDTFIAEQSELIAKLDQWLWDNGYGPRLPHELERRLRDYR